MQYAADFRVRFFAFFLLFLLVLSGCKSTNDEQKNTGAEQRSKLARDLNPQTDAADLAAAAAGNTNFALKALPLLDPQGGSNTVFSPYSITLALALAAPGARGATLSGIEQALSFPLPQERLNPAFNKLDLLMASKTTGTVHNDGSQSPRLNVANAVWAQQDFPVLPEYLDTLAVNFGAGLRIVDFTRAPEDSRIAINIWVEDQTNNRIKELLGPGSIASDTRLVLTNAIWFKADWASPFKKESTADNPFVNRDGSTASVPFMRQSFQLPYNTIHGCQAVDIPYVDGKLSMLVVMPDAGTFDAFLSKLTPTVLADVTSGLTRTQVALSMPKFTFDSSLDLESTMRSLGMIDAFQINADFSGIDGRRDLFISGVFHKAFISVDEKGTEAAAATGVVIVTTSAPPPPLVLTIDHPFLFLLRDRETGLILFMGKVVSLR